MVRLTKEERTRRRIVESLGELSTNATYNLSDLVEKHGNDVIIAIQEECYTGYPEITISLHRVREETDEEYDSRLENLRAERAENARRTRERKKAEEAQERALYERLKAKFGD